MFVQRKDDKLISIDKTSKKKENEEKDVIKQRVNQKDRKDII